MKNFKDKVHGYVLVLLILLVHLVITLCGVYMISASDDLYHTPMGSFVITVAGVFILAGVAWSLFSLCLAVRDTRR